jgi:uncharacterized protein (DUF433 family)
MATAQIVCKPGVLGGKPCIEGTRISVEHVLELLATGASPDEVVAAHPQLTREGVQAALAYAAGSLRNESVWVLKIPA